jgi:hypothetical protein
MNSYAKQQNIDPKMLRFMTVEGDRILPEHTPDSLHMEDGDCIDVFQEQIGGMNNPEARDPANDKPEEADVPKHINLKVRDQSGNEVTYKIKRVTALQKLMATHASQISADIKSLRFMFDGTRIQDEDSPISLEMNELDCIDVFQEQIGGLVI